jgi:hypothetical protein
MVLATDMKQHFSILSHFNTVHRLSAYSQQTPASSSPSPPKPPKRMLRRTVSRALRQVPPAEDTGHRRKRVSLRLASQSTPRRCAEGTR